MRCVKELKENMEKTSDKPTRSRTIIKFLKNKKKRKDQKDFKIMFFVQ